MPRSTNDAAMPDNFSTPPEAPLNDPLFDPDDDGQPDEAHEWADFDPDC